MPLDNDTCDVKMPSLEGKAWAGANGDWVGYIGSNCECELVNVYTRQQVPLPKISECPVVEHIDDLRTFKYDHGDCRLRKIAICRVPNRSWDYTNYEVVAIFDKLVAILRGLTGWIFLKNQFLYTDEYCDAIEYEGLLCLLPPLMALFLHGIVMISVRLSSTVIIIVSSTCMRVSKFPFTN